MKKEKTQRINKQELELKKSPVYLRINCFQMLFKQNAAFFSSDFTTRESHDCCLQNTVRRLLPYTLPSKDEINPSHPRGK